MKKNDIQGLKKYQKSILKGYGLGILLVIIFLGIMAFIISIRDLPNVIIDPIVVLITAIGGLFGGLLAARSSREKGMMIGFVVGALMFLTIVILSIISKTFAFGYLALVKFFALTLAGSIGGIWGVNLRSKRK